MPKRGGWAPPFGEPDPDAALELHATEGQVAEGEGEGPPPEIISDEPPLEEPAVRPPEQAELERKQREAEIVHPEVEAHEPGPVPPVRGHHQTHIVVTERRGNARWSTHSVIVGTKPVQLLGLNEARRRVRLQIAYSSGDGYYLAVGPLNRVPANVSTTVGGGDVMPTRLATAYLVPLMVPGGESPVPFAPDDLPLDTVREVFAVFVPDTGLESNGQQAVVSVSEETGDMGLETERTVPAGAGADR
ncbi:MAG: hypothetical protein ABSE66_09835 [Thermoplasmata archaeon]|jgi:hypothetical protein